MDRYTILILILLAFGQVSIAQSDEVWFHPNRGQWDSRIQYRVELQQGDFFIEKDKFTYALSDLGEVYHAAHHDEEIGDIQHHTIFSHFVNSSWEGEVVESDTSVFYRNYMLGNDRSKWKSKVYSFKTLEFIDFYPGIDLILETFPDKIKYSFRVSPMANPSDIQIEYEGMTGLEVDDKQIEIKTRFGSIFENELIAWEEGTKNRKVPVRFEKENNRVHFVFPNGYDSTQTLIIDPSLTFSTFTGSTSDNWGFTATPDEDGSLYAGGIVFGGGYPISAGAYSNAFNGGTGFYHIDMGITKFSADGSQLLYSTYLGGSGNETPNSIIATENGDLYILGISTSLNFPITPNAYQTQNNGGQTTTQIAISFDGTDLVICKLSHDGTSLLASTFMGGAENDGLNISSLNYNYGDVFRGEIIIDQQGNVVFTSSTQSPDFPIVNGSDGSLGGTQDAVIVKMTPDLSTVIWSTYFGGDQDDSGFSIQTSSDNNLYVTGGTKSTSLPFSGGFQSSYQGGASDGYIAIINGNNSTILGGTYVGTSSYDQSFFVQLDMDDNVYVFGQTAGNMTISSGVYSNSNSGQFIQQYSKDLTTQNWSTRVGGGNGVVEISPTAFLVSNCKEIYFTGWGGQINQSVQAVGSTSNGFPTTPDAYQSNTNGNNFYIGVLAENATGLNYGTFMGGAASSYNHVDGGTSRFDKHGSIYHAVCAACGGNPNGFTTTPGVWSQTNNSSNCNMAAWKFDLYKIVSEFSLPDVIICLPDSAFFINESSNGTNYFWDFGDGTTSTEYEPHHYYSTPGIYEVMLIVSDANGCTLPDTSYLEIEIADFDGGDLIAPDIVCPGIPFQLEASGGTTYQWFPEEYLDSPTIPNPTAVINNTTEFTVIISDGCGADTISVVVEVADISSTISSNQEMCIGDVIQLEASGGVEYLWTATDENAIIGPNDQAVITVSPTVNTIFTVDIVTADGCEKTETVFVVVYQDLPYSNLEDTVRVCKNEEVTVQVDTDAQSIVWSPNEGLNTSEGHTVVITTDVNKWYFVDLINACGVVQDSVFIEVVETNPEAGNDTIVCPGDSAYVWASGGVEYEWMPSTHVAFPDSSMTTVYPPKPTEYTVYITDETGCIDSASVFVDHYPEATVYTNPDYYGFVGDEVMMIATGNSPGGTYTWSPDSYISCTSCSNATANPPNSITYIVTFEDENGCIGTDSYTIHYETLIYVPNTFTPDGNEFNNEFLAIGGNIESFEMKIFNRWGELLFESKDIKFGWDGTYGGKLCQDGTYIWKIKYQDLDYNEVKLVGHVNLLR